MRGIAAVMGDLYRPGAPFGLRSCAFAQDDSLIEWGAGANRLFHLYN